MLPNRHRATMKIKQWTKLKMSPLECSTIFTVLKIMSFINIELVWLSFEIAVSSEIFCAEAFVKLRVYRRNFENHMETGYGPSQGETKFVSW